MKEQGVPIDQDVSDSLIKLCSLKNHPTEGVEIWKWCKENNQVYFYSLSK